MKETLRLEEIAMTALGIYLLKFHHLGLPIWAWCLLFFAPDISMSGYLVNSKIGAVTYNLFHHKGFAITLIGIGYFVQVEVLMAIGILLFAHSSFDRIMGYGLKYQTSFNDTHLGKLKKDS